MKRNWNICKNCKNKLIVTQGQVKDITTSQIVSPAQTWMSCFSDVNKHNIHSTSIRTAIKFKQKGPKPTLMSDYELDLFSYDIKEEDWNNKDIPNSCSQKAEHIILQQEEIHE